MSLLDRIERKFGKIYLPNLLPTLLLGQVIVYVALLTQEVDPVNLAYIPRLVRAGEQVWGVFTFMVLPMNMNPLFFFISISITWLMGNALQEQWGEFRFCFFLGFAWFATVVVTLLMPMYFLVVPNVYIYGLLTLAFAKLFPNFEFLAFFIVPVKVKYFGYILWAWYALQFIGGELGVRLVIVVTLSSWVLFFGGEVLGQAKARQRRTKFQRDSRRDGGTAFHQCSVCGKTDQSHPQIHFRYQNGKCYCAAYLQEGSCDEDKKA